MSPELVRKPLHYDAIQRRLWIRGQRCHHGATGAVLAGAGAFGLVALRAPALAAIIATGGLLTLRSPLLSGLVAAGGVLMLHDWQDRRSWFAKGWQA